jgi:conjugal transfer mating pair stabilization protein TraN
LPNTFTYLVSKSVTITNPGDCRNPILLVSIDQGDYKKNKHKTRGIYADIIITSQDNPVVSDTMVGDCSELNKRVNSGICKIGKEVCVSGLDTKTINGIEITRDCWRYKTNYHCGESTEVDDCSGLMTRDCVQVSSECRDNKDGICTSFTRGYRCPIQSCQDDTNIICGDSTIHCIDGSCISKTNNDSSDFNESISKLAVIDAAIKDKPQNFSEDTKFIFSGKVLSCRKTGYGFSDCCKDGGWGVDLGLAHCNSEEKSLGESKENKLVIYVGKNSHKTSELEPERVDKRYCVFSSKIARIIQEQGRFGQLGISFGSGKYPDCSGISAKMLSQIDMDKINLAEITDEIAGAHKDYDSSAVGNKLTTRIKDYYTKEVAFGE